MNFNRENLLLVIRILWRLAQVLMAKMEIEEGIGRDGEEVFFVMPTSKDK
jgi:hypothetical protein